MSEKLPVITEGLVAVRALSGQIVDPEDFREAKERGGLLNFSQDSTLQAFNTEPLYLSV